MTQRKSLNNTCYYSLIKYCEKDTQSVGGYRLDEKKSVYKNCTIAWLLHFYYRWGPTPLLGFVMVTYLQIKKNIKLELLSYHKKNLWSNRLWRNATLFIQKV